MPLENFGVLSGTLHRHFRDRPDAQGRWYHVHLEVDTPEGRYACAVDVDSKKSAVGVQWKVFTLHPSVLEPVDAPSPGYHDLATASGSGAIDYQRHPALAERTGCLFVRRPPGWVQRILDRIDPPRPWTAGSHLEASAALEPILVPGRPVLVFGEPFDEGLGMHNIHQNQGDPAGSQWWDENGTWQDGATMTRRPDGLYDVFLSKFSTQADTTDADGHPV
ncbi:MULTISPECIES: DUF2278 family protein [Streptomyces]|uniref:DUF2278 family protein n=1 Tax=Streptomyces TaxID=1883 RepID=UPI0016768598|nr:MULTISPECIES: DUF2278 family protein [Streptomyces]MBD3578651.1 DUF2278 family protein [Streptomyces sp. KD18]GGT19614.1 hypothetical protein GCM10010286_51480 [Streptomyces toxytricini]